MSDPKDGGPVSPTGGPDFVNDCPGMTLRDWFAGQAINGIIAGNEGFCYEKEDAREAYKIADAMIQARDANNAQ